MAQIYSDGYTFDDVLIEPQGSEIRSRRDVDLSSSPHPLINLRLPIISSNMDTITGPEMCVKMKQLGGMGILHRFNTIDENTKDFLEVKTKSGGSDYIGCSLGINEGVDRLNALYEAGCRIFCIDVAHGHSKHVADFTKFCKVTHPDICLIVGNVATWPGAKYLIDNGADILKVGIGGGSVCSTRIKTGCGVPQLTAIIDTTDEGPIIADGGCRSSGDIAKALAAGAQLVMLGGILAGTDETPGEVFQGYKIYRGNASREVVNEKLGGMTEWKTSEGISTEVLTKGPVADIIKDIEGGLRSALTYVGARNLAEFRANARFIKITNAGMVESHPHILNRSNNG